MHGCRHGCTATSRATVFLQKTEISVRPAHFLKSATYISKELLSPHRAHTPPTPRIKASTKEQPVMSRVRLISHSVARRGAILMVVLVLLTLFAILGLSFVLYANAQAKSSDLHRQAEADPSGLNGPDADPDTLATTLLSTFVYGADD